MTRHVGFDENGKRFEILRSRTKEGVEEVEKAASMSLLSTVALKTGA